MGLPRNELEARLIEIETDCADTFIGYLMEVLGSIDDTTGVESTKVLDVMSADVRQEVGMPLRCVVNELTSMFPSITNANGEINAKIKSIVHDDF